MEQFARRDIVLVRFPFSDLSSSKLRPALVLATAEYGDLLLCQITSKHYADRSAILIDSGDFDSGALPVSSYVRPGRLFAADRGLIIRNLGRLNPQVYAAICNAIHQLITGESTSSL